VAYAVQSSTRIPALDNKEGFFKAFFTNLSGFLVDQLMLRITEKGVDIWTGNTTSDFLSKQD